MTASAQPLLDNAVASKLPLHDGVNLEVPHPGILVVNLNRPAQRNAIDRKTNSVLNSIWDYYESSSDLWCTILTGTDPVFCAGLDLVEAGRTKSITDAAEMLFGGFGGLSFRRTLNKPVIAAVNGPATGGGFELALACDIVVASRDATFALPEVKHGLSPLGGGAANLARVIGYQNAMLLMLTGRTFSAVEMKDLGFVQTIVDPKDVLDTAISLAREIAANSPDAVRCAKAQAKLGLELGWQSANKGSLLLPEVAAMFAGSNFREGPRAFKEKRPANWKTPLEVSTWTTRTTTWLLWGMSTWVAAKNLGHAQIYTAVVLACVAVYAFVSKQ